MRVALALIPLAALAGCGSPYGYALDSGPEVQPPPHWVHPTDDRALAAYDAFGVTTTASVSDSAVPPLTTERPPEPMAR
ncbi:MAG: hypothetical protein ACM33T_16925 [Solirubrobacterales bacterium]